MTTTDPTTETSPVTGDVDEPELCWLNLADLAPHPDNPRSSLGDLTELVRSIRSHGILEPLVVLPADDDGVYRIIAGHRRHAAGIKAGVTDVPAVVRHMTAGRGHRGDAVARTSTAPTSPSPRRFGRSNGSCRSTAA